VLGDKIPTSQCPRLADATLGACGDPSELFVLSARLHRLVLRCCHELVAVVCCANTKE
jgi:hypothetical protein